MKTNDPIESRRPHPPPLPVFFGPFVGGVYLDNDLVLKLCRADYRLCFHIVFAHRVSEGNVPISKSRLRSGLVE